jgi:hypothetical protein
MVIDDYTHEDVEMLMGGVEGAREAANGVEGAQVHLHDVEPRAGDLLSEALLHLHPVLERPCWYDHLCSPQRKNSGRLHTDAICCSCIYTRQSRMHAGSITLPPVFVLYMLWININVLQIVLRPVVNQGTRDL